jgi:hypothetical protein
MLRADTFGYTYVMALIIGNNLLQLDLMKIASLSHSLSLSFFLFLAHKLSPYSHSGLFRRKGETSKRARVTR